jgi:acetyltransferase
MEGEVVLRDGARVPVRPMRPDDTERLKRFHHALSPRSRYQRFMQHLEELPPQMLARFTQVDYERELALVALSGEDFIAVGRYAPNEDGETAEFALVVADAWQGKGLGRILLERLREAARKAGYKALYGSILGLNREMLELVERLGFVVDSREGAGVIVVSRLDSRPARAG